MIREAQAADRDRIVEMGLRFIAGSSYRGVLRPNPEALARTVDATMASPAGAVLVLDVAGKLEGMVLAVLYEHPFTGDRTAQELAWWVEPEARSTGGGVRLLRAVEKWARESGALSLQMIAPNPEVGALYDRLGYRPMETAFQRSL